MDQIVDETRRNQLFASTVQDAISGEGKKLPMRKAKLLRKQLHTTADE
jgi:hypothetical protein